MEKETTNLNLLSNDVISNSVHIDDIKSFIRSWNIRFPLDRWWREKYRIPIFSEKHKDSCFIDMHIEFLEDEMFRDIALEVRKESEDDNDDIMSDKYIAGQRNIFKSGLSGVDMGEVEKVYDNIKIENIVEK